MNEYGWPTRAVIRATRKHVLKQLLKYAPVGKRPHLQVIIDLTTLEKRGKFKAFAKLIQILHGKRGLHIVVMYLVVGTWRVPWAFRPWRGKDKEGVRGKLPPAHFRTVTPAQLVKRFVISTRVLKGSTITWWGRRRWAIEGFCKTVKYQFGLASFGQQKLLGVYRWLILSNR